MSAYDAFASAYDILNTEIDYDKMAEHITAVLHKYKINKDSLVLDLGCGTGHLTKKLAEKGFDMTGVDSSEEMLNCARDYIDNQSVLLLLQDICEFELYGTVAAVVSTTDTINHITDENELRHTFDLVHNYLDYDGIFIFDVNSPYKFENVYGTNDYVLEDENVFLAWQNDYDAETELADFYITLFEKGTKNTWKRSDTQFDERCYSLEKLELMLKESGFEIESVTDSYSDTSVSEETERYVICAKRV